MRPPSILVVEDDPSISTLIGAVLRHHGYEYEMAADGESAIRAMRSRTFSAVLLDLMLPRINGFDVLQFVRAEQSHMMSSIIVITAAADRTLQHFDRRSVGAFLRKPFDLAELVEAVRMCTGSAVQEQGLPAAPPD